MANKFKKFNLEEAPIVSENERILEQEQGRAEAPVPDASALVNHMQTAQPIPEFNQQMQTTAQPATPASQPQVAQPAVVSTPSPYKGEGWGEGLVLKNVGAKIPYSIYDRLERIKRQSERSGIKADKRNIGDLIAQAIKEFVEKYDVQ